MMVHRNPYRKQMYQMNVVYTCVNVDKTIFMLHSFISYNFLLFVSVVSKTFKTLTDLKNNEDISVHANQKVFTSILIG